MSTIPDRSDGSATLELDDGSLIVYDRDNHRAWLQSDGAVALADAR